MTDAHPSEGFVELARRMAAPPDIVFAYFTDGERYSLWQGVEGVQ